jgi:hypothetical protein
MPLTSHQLSSDGRESQAVHNLWREERERTQRHTVANVRQIMREHSGTEQCLHDLPSRSMLVGISSSSDLDAGLDEFLVVFSEPLGARRVVGQKEQGQESTEHGDEAFDDELETY